MGPATEETPLLKSPDSRDDVYNRFSPARKIVIVAVTALTGTWPMVASGSFIPLIPQIAKDLDSSGEVVSLAVSLSILANALGSLIWASYSGFYGRKNVLLYSMLAFAVGSVMTGLAGTVTELLVWRVIQAFGASSGLSVGIGVLADIYRMEERGSSSGVFFGAVLLGMSLAPAAGGITAYYSSWRTTQYALAGAALLSFFLTLLLQPETSQPGMRGVDELIEREGRSRWVWLNPFGGLALLRSPNVLLISLSQGLIMITDYVLLTPIAYTMGVKYGITNEAILGAICIPVGVGNVFGSSWSGQLSDKMLVKWRKYREGVWVPEDRLRASLFGGLILVPGSMVASGLLTHFGDDSNVSLAFNLFFFFVNGFGVSAVFNPQNAYLVDILHSQSAEVTAANMACRNLIVAFTVGFIIFSINTFGLLATFIGSAVIAWVGFGLVLLVIRYGDRMRAWVDLGFTTEEED